MGQKENGGSGARTSKAAFLLLAVIMAACIIAQTALAGAAVFGDIDKWRWHVNFVHIFEWVPLLMLIFSFTGKLPASLRWQSGALFLLVIAQYFTANFAGAGLIHPVIALVMFGMSVSVILKAARVR